MADDDQSVQGEEALAEAAPAPAPKAPETLDPPKFAGCSPAACGLEPRRWADIEHWYCDACNFSTFSADEAAGRRPSHKS
ncbi:hypothetical protein [uncultured Alsobacter sp.]|uniref:hypothetical protein n=1 Tax=uncultured Alsobacter sp. TaxID=1748258 RepID=UPI0025D1D231|nr:hypothetical protein [uncultured Alsobacter sp.]